MTSTEKISVNSGTNKTTLFIWSAAVLIFASAYFLLSYNRTLNPVDEGYLLNNCVKVAEGQVPHRDFYDDYGPASFWLGAALFKLFGIKIIVIRIFLVGLKAIMALLIFLMARKLLPVGFALAAAALFVLNWGDPYLPAINILYAGHLCQFFALIGILCMMQYIERDNRWWLFGTSIAVGASLLSKFPSAIFDFIGFSVFLTLLAQARRSDVRGEPADHAHAWPRLMNAGKALGLISVMAFYLVLFSFSGLNLYYFFIFLLPYYLLLGYMLISESGSLVQRKKELGALKNDYLDILILSSGLFLFWLFEIAYYLFVNGLNEFLYDTFILPLQINFHSPMADIRLHTILIACLTAAVLALVGLAGRIRHAPARTREAFWAGSLLAVGALPAALLLRETSLAEWHLRATHIVPPVTLFLSAVLFLSAWHKDKSAYDRKRLSLGLLLIFGCQHFLLGFPRVDEPHIQMNTTVLFVLIAVLLFQLSNGWSRLLGKNGRTYGMISTFAVLMLLAVPQLWSMKTFHVFRGELTMENIDKIPFEIHLPISTGALKRYPELTFDFPRSRGISVPLWVDPPLHPFVIRDAYKIIDFLRKNSAPNDRILVVGESQIIYLLAERESVISKQDYFFFLATTELIDSGDVGKFPDEALVERLAQNRPRYIIVPKTGSSVHGTRITNIWPKSAEFIEKNYEIAKFIGHYVILQPR